MEVYSADGPLHLVETDVVEALEARAADGPHTVVRHEEVLLPSHEDVLALADVFVSEVRLLRLFGERPPSWEARPMLHVRLVRRSPGFVLGLKCVLGPDYLAFEERCEGWVVLSEACVGRSCQRRALFTAAVGPRPYPEYVGIRRDRTRSYPHV